MQKNRIDVLLLPVLLLAMIVVITYNSAFAQAGPIQSKPLSTPLQGNKNTYTNATNGITVAIPQGWSVEEGQNLANDTVPRVVILSPPISLDPNALANVAIYKNTKPATNSLDGILRDEISILRSSNPGFALISANTNSTISGHTGYELLFSYESPSLGPFKQLEAGLLLNGKAYFIVYSADTKIFSNFLPQVKKIIDSFTIRPNA